MRNNILGGLVIFFVVVTCLLMLDDITSKNEVNFSYKTIEVEQKVEQPTDLAVLDEEE
ncbi:hypothetical protein [uncultured Winogradskyella sp.]|uniref:hypothetical protein n=1 Tax=uncultured Winogradskyella sp. TaxID=395353 RepID=UPI0026164F48|nr:hypothetical protein [uncultured Winogradskyella sp.]|tara:strand:- start:8853 stop:9026 length:174 start_codon:yes stop_codon:yes gene_type:complete